MFRMEWNSWEKVGRCKYKVAKKKLVDNRNRNVDEFLWLTFLRTQIVYGTRLSLTFAYKCRIDDAKTVKCFESLEIHSLHFLQKQNRIQMHSFTGSNEKQFYCDTPCASVHKFTNGSVTFTVKWHTKINRPEEKEEEHRRRWKGVENKTHFDVLTHVLLRLSSKHNWIGYIRAHWIRTKAAAAAAVATAATTSTSLALLHMSRILVCTWHRISMGVKA